MRKYRNVKVTTEAGTFDSKREHARYLELLMMQRQKSISNLRRQVEYILIPAQRDASGKAIRAVKYIADFVYDLNGKQVVEDVKSEATRKLPAYVLKFKLMIHVHGITIKEVT
ncbi:DUF1064 domain-containing protein [Ralstonia sp. TCR112]|uniref:DUF1064 domain-containing protein n=1 Tax=Ralstonia sp. TCR112 TaxID=2601730 RepID=UPI00164CA3C1|nr:DUF1064 domain-containing protein [Ralstonia sp. TCR112]